MPLELPSLSPSETELELLVNIRAKPCTALICRFSDFSSTTLKLLRFFPDLSESRYHTAHDEVVADVSLQHLVCRCCAFFFRRRYWRSLYLGRFVRLCVFGCFHRCLRQVNLIPIE